jgi:hypothetical protein
LCFQTYFSITIAALDNLVCSFTSSITIAALVVRFFLNWQY